MTTSRHHSESIGIESIEGESIEGENIEGESIECESKPCNQHTIRLTAYESVSSRITRALVAA